MSENTAGRVSIIIGADTKPAEKGLKKIEKSLKGFGKIGKANNKIFSDFLRLASVAGLTKMTLDAAHLSHSIDVLGQRTGMTTSKLSKMQNVWEALGSDAKAFDTWAKNVTSSLWAASRGEGSPIEEALAGFGLTGLNEFLEPKDLLSLLGEISNAVSELSGNGNYSMSELQDLLEKRLNIPYEVSSKMFEGEEKFYAYIQEASQRTGNLTEENIKSLNALDLAYKSFSAAMATNLKNSLATVVETTNAVNSLNKVSDFFAKTPNFFLKAVGAPGEALYEAGRWTYELFAGSPEDNLIPKYTKEVEDILRMYRNATIDYTQVYDMIKDDQELKKAVLYYAKHGDPKARFGEGSGDYTTKQLLDYVGKELGYYPDTTNAETVTGSVLNQIEQVNNNNVTINSNGSLDEQTLRDAGNELIEYAEDGTMIIWQFADGGSSN